jgi:hypothetical protein
MSKMTKKKLTSSVVQKMEAKLNETRKFTILGGEFEHNIFVKLRKTDVQDLIIEYYDALSEMSQKEGLTTKVVIDGSSLLNILMIKYFTDVPVEAVGIEALIKLSNAYNNLGIFDEIFGNEANEVNGFTKEQVNYVMERIKKAADAINQQYEVTVEPEASGEVDGGIQ